MNKPRKHFKTKKINMKNKTKRLKFKLKGGSGANNKNKTQTTIESITNKNTELTPEEIKMLRKLGYRIAQAMSNPTAERIVKRALGI